MKNRAALDKIKAFAMSNQMLLTDLSKISSEYGIEIGIDTQKNAQTVDSSYYSQFTIAARAEAAAMAEHYQVFYCLERSIRDLVSTTIESAEKNIQWWATPRIPDRIRDEVQGRITKEVDTGMTKRSEAEIDYTTFGELAQIIVSNWDIFGAIFESKRAVERIMGNLNSLRAPIAHCCRLGEDEVVRLNLSVRDWFRLME